MLEGTGDGQASSVLVDGLEGGGDQRFRRLIAGLHVGVVVQGPASEILMLNPAALELLGVTEAEILGKTSFDPYWRITREDGSDFPANERPVAMVLAKRQRVSNVVIGVHRPVQRDHVWLLINAEPEFDADGGIKQVVATLADITERRHLEASLSQARKLESIGRLAGGVAHDFNNLLTVIIGSTSLVLASLPEHAPERTELGHSLEAAQRAASLTRQLLTFARRQVTVPTCIDLADALRAIEPLLARLIGEHIELSVLTDGDTWPVDVDPVQLEQVIVNLAVNARDAMPNGGKLTIEAGKVKVDLPAGEYAVLRFSDTGRGMDAETREHLFEPFFSTKELGTGLGLATVYGIIEHHGGFVTVESEPGRGATFLVHLRRSSQQPVRAAPPASSAEHARGKGTILVIEDEPLVRKLARTVLEKHGYQVLVAGDGHEGVACAEAHVGPIDVVITDLVMPRLDGNRAAAKLRAARPDIVTIFTSGYTDQEISLSDGGFLPKPYTPAQLLERVRIVLRKSAESQVGHDR